MGEKDNNEAYRQITITPERDGARVALMVGGKTITSEFATDHVVIERSVRRMLQHWV